MSEKIKNSETKENNLTQNDLEKVSGGVPYVDEGFEERFRRIKETGHIAEKKGNVDDGIS